MDKPTLLYLPVQSHTDLVFEPKVWKRLNRLTNLVQWDTAVPCNSENLAGRIADADMLVTAWGSPKITTDALNRAARLRLIAHAAGSVRSMLTVEDVKNIVIPRGIRVFSGNRAIAYNVAESTVGMMIMGARHWVNHAVAYRERGVWRDPNIPKNGQCLLGATVGLVSCSTVAREVIPLLRPFRTKVLVYDPFLNDDEAKRLRVKRVDLQTLFRESHIVSLHLPLLPETENLIKAEHLKLMRDGSVLVNTSRGKVLDHDALYQEAKTGRITVVLDVTDPEPLPKDHPLRPLPNVIFTPHVAGAGFYGYFQIGATLVKAIEAAIAGKPFEGEVPLQRLERVA